METKILSWDEIETAVAILKQGGIVAFPTETVYGLACLSSFIEAYDKLVALKKRPPAKPFTLMCASFTDILRHAHIDRKSMHVLHEFMPGPITALLKVRDGIAKHIHLGLPTIGVRIPDYPPVRTLIEKVGAPLLVPSANIAGESPCVRFEEVKEVFGGKVQAIIQGECPGQKASTIVDLTGEPTMVREGPLSEESIRAAYDNAPNIEIALASDHGGFLYKERIKQHLSQQGYETMDFGTNSLASCDYPLFAAEAAKAVASGKANLGVLVCTSGEGIMMAANKIKGVRCGIGYDDVATGKMREHNNANMVAFGQAYMKEEDVLRRVDIFLGEVFSPEAKHHRRVDEILDLE